ncbi:MAG: flagellar assembly protein FliW [Bryobacteraceae bacterium]|jgi:flagellar assembly factor FliW
MARVQTKFFGSLEYSPSSVFLFPGGLPGFEEQREFVFLNLPERDPLIFMQSLSTRNLCFVLLPIFVVDPQYGLDFTPEELIELNLPLDRPPAIGKDILCAAMIGSAEGATPTANLMAPVIVNLKERIGAQVIHGDSGYSHRHPLLFEEPALTC